VALGSGLDQLVVAGRRENVGQGQDVLELRVFGGQPDGLSPARLERILDNVENMHDAVVELTRDPAAKFGIAYLDSGSDFMVAFSSAKEVIGYLANCFAVVRRLRSLGIDAMRTESAFISQQLEVLKRLGEAVEAGTLTPERGNHIRQRLLTHLEAVCEAGVTLDGEAVEVLETDRRLIAAAQQRRLLGSGGAGNAESMGSAGDESKATDES
jgi:hypothetical protein